MAKNNRLVISTYTAISILSSAPFIALYVVLVLYYNSFLLHTEFLLLIATLVLSPILITIYYSRKLGIEWDFPERKYKIKPFTLIVLFYLLGLVLLLFIEADFYSIFLQFAYLVNGVLSLSITLRTKISLHVAGIMGPSIYLFIIKMFLHGCILFILSIFVGYVRILLRRHTLGQVILGGIVSIISTIIAYCITTILQDTTVLG